ncbi:MAG TPA: MFS transporter [Dehalococcoidia bacterium]|nr:MFS transporter [Dehalococcoidia bacterium]
MSEPDEGSGTGTQPRPSRLPRTFTSLRHPNFRLLWTTSLINAASNWLQQVTLSWLAYDLTDSALVAGLVFGIRALPSLVIGPIGGVLGDRFERKRGLQINSGYMAVLALGFAVLLSVGNVQAWHILLFTFLQGTGQAMVNPVRQALVANTVPREDLMNAIALNSLAQTSMRVVGPAIAGVLIAVSGPALNFGIQSVAYVLVFVLAIPLRAPYTDLQARRQGASLTSSFVEGIAYVRKQPTLMGLILLALVPTLFTTPINLGLLPVFARDALHADSAALGLLYSAQGMGAVLGTLALASLGNFRNKGLLLSGAAACLTVAITLYSQVTVFLLALPLVALGTCCFMTYNTINQTIIQTITPDEYRGRVMGLHMMDHGLSPLGAFLFGTLAELYGVRLSIFVAGVCAMTSVAFVLTFFPAIRSFRSGVPAESVSPQPATRRIRESVAAAPE